jgi:UDP-N-acetylglucosamine 4-epimerase
MDACREALSGVDYVLHQAAIGSVPRSMQRPLESHASNVDGFINVILAARDAGVRRVVYASSSSVYGSDEQTYKREDSIGAPLSPYAATKRIDEVYASAFLRAFGLDSVGLRYFNVFGARQDPNGPYAAVIARWAELLLRGKPCLLFGDGNKSRDFCYIDNVVQANLLAATVPASELTSRVMNIACGSATTLSQLFELIRERAAEFRPGCLQIPLVQMEARAGDIDHSLADISLAQRCLGYEPTHSVEQGLDHTIRWFAEGAPFAQSRCPATRSAAA